MADVQPIPEGYSRVTPYLIVSGVPKLVEFLEKVFGATVSRKMVRPDGVIMHVEVRIGDAPIMMGESSDQWKATPGSIYIYDPDVDSAYQRAVNQGASVIMTPADQFYGDRHCGVIDPTGNTWWISTHIEDVSDEEMLQRAAAIADEETH